MWFSSNWYSIDMKVIFESVYDMLLYSLSENYFNRDISDTMLGNLGRNKFFWNSSKWVLKWPKKYAFVLLCWQFVDWHLLFIIQKRSLANLTIFIHFKTLGFTFIVCMFIYEGSSFPDLLCSFFKKMVLLPIFLFCIGYHITHVEI